MPTGRYPSKYLPRGWTSQCPSGRFDGVRDMETCAVTQRGGLTWRGGSKCPHDTEYSWPHALLQIVTRATGPWSALGLDRLNGECNMRRPELDTRTSLARRMGVKEHGPMRAIASCRSTRPLSFQAVHQSGLNNVRLWFPFHPALVLGVRN
jgi:hypothetical protein